MGRFLSKLKELQFPLLCPGIPSAAAPPSTAPVIRDAVRAEQPPPATQAVSDSVVQWESLTPDRAQTFQGTFQLHRKFSHWLPSAFLAKTLAQLPALMPDSHKALEHLSHLCCSPVPLHISWFSLTFKLCSYKTVL